MVKIPAAHMIEMHLPEGKNSNEVRIKFMNLDHRAIIIYDNMDTGFGLPTSADFQKILDAAPEEIVLAVLAKNSLDAHASFKGYIITSAEGYDFIVNNMNLLPKVVLLLPWHVVEDMVLE
jgi:hypothetical protein